LPSVWLGAQRAKGLRRAFRKQAPAHILSSRPYASGALAATQLWEGTCNTDIFNQWLEDLLCPLLDETCVVIMDNATFHKSVKTRELIETKGAVLLFLPPYSPDLNPIEGDFAALKKIREYNHEKSIDQIINMYR